VFFSGKVFRFFCYQVENLFMKLGDDLLFLVFHFWVIFIQLLCRLKVSYLIKILKSQSCRIKNFPFIDKLVSTDSSHYLGFSSRELFQIMILASRSC